MNKDKEILVFTIARIVAIVFLILAYFKNPIGFYTLLRFVVTATCAYGASVAKKFEKTFWMLLMIFVSFLFNPIIPVYLKREQWEIIDAVVVFILLLSIPFLQKPKIN